MHGGYPQQTRRTHFRISTGEPVKWRETSSRNLRYLETLGSNLREEKEEKIEISYIRRIISLPLAAELSPIEKPFRVWNNPI